jgi:hypothetical protein
MGILRWVWVGRDAGGAFGGAGSLREGRSRAWEKGDQAGEGVGSWGGSEGRQRSGAVGAERTGLERRGLRSRASGGGSPEGQGHGDEGATSAVGALARIATHEALKEVSPVFAMVAGRV